MSLFKSFFDQPLPRFPLTAVSDYRTMAQKKLPQQLFEFLEGGAFDEVTIQRNSAAFQSVQLKRHVLKDVSKIDMGTEIFDQSLAFPLILAPVGFAGIYARRGEVQAARAAAKAKIPFSLSTVSICSIEEVAQYAPDPFWFQFYMFKELGHSEELLQRALDAQCSVLLLTVDLPMAGARHRYHRSRRRSLLMDWLDMAIHPRWLIDVRLRGGPHTIGNVPKSAPALTNLAEMRRWMGSQLNQSFTWDQIEWVRNRWPGKIVIKGILEPEDALIAKKIGADGLVVSNHGGRHLDGTLSTIEALPAICAAVKGDLKILIDGGIMSGLDLFKALAIGADACMIGKPWIYGLAARGETGVSEVLTILQNELKIAMTHFGVSSISQIHSIKKY